MIKDVIFLISFKNGKRKEIHAVLSQAPLPISLLEERAVHALDINISGSNEDVQESTDTGKSESDSAVGAFELVGGRHCR